MNQGEQAPVIIFGAGKIARGYVGHLVALSGRPICFVEVNETVVRLINKRGRYRVHILGNDGKSMTVTHIRALHTSDPRVADVLAQAELAFVSVGGPTLPAAAATLAPGLAARRAAGGPPRYIVCCETWHP